ncbi:unnamed protein product [marine sediment metagenome]|uniref:Uncharacterized protein n=1 Tax=marine sediment metagenome TaxID=412755 RepID=X1BIH8_9ZZZZ
MKLFKRKEYSLNWCPQCNQVVAIDKYGFIKCSRCKRSFIVDLHYKQEKVDKNGSI